MAQPQAKSILPNNRNLKFNLSAFINDEVKLFGLPDLLEDGNFEETSTQSTIGFGILTDQDNLTIPGLLAINFSAIIINKDNRPIYKANLTGVFALLNKDEFTEEEYVFVPREIGFRLLSVVIGAIRGLIFAHLKHTPVVNLFIPPVLLEDLIIQEISIFIKPKNIVSDAP